MKHVFKQFVFVHSTNYRKNSGIFVIPTKHCTLLGNSSNQSKGTFGNRQPNMNQYIRPHRRRTTGNDPKMQTLVLITRGNWKGYTGIVKNCEKDTYTVELQTNAKRVKVPRNDVKDHNPNPASTSLDRQPRVESSMTPRANTYSIQTPSAFTPSYPSTPGIIFLNRLTS